LLGYAGAPITAPTLAWDEEADDATADFLIGFDSTVQAGDVVRLQHADNEAFAAATDTTDTLDAAEAAARQVAMALPELANGTYYARARIKRGSGASSPWSNVETVTIAV
jgi:hypothetical protein